MAIKDISTLVWEPLEYYVDKFDININGKVTSLITGQIRELYLEKDFDSLNLPIFIVSIGISEELYYNIHNNHKDTTFVIKISTKKKNKNGGKSTNKSSFLSGSFNVLGIDGKPFTNEKEYKKIRKHGADSRGNMMSDLANQHTFILGKKNIMSNIKKIHNVVFTSANMTEATNYVLSSSGINNVLMTPFDNNTSYSELVLLPIPLIQQLQYLNSMYGFYKEGAQIFFDFDRNYILRNCAKCTAYEKNEIKKVVMVVYKNMGGKSTDKGSTTVDKVGYMNIGTGYNLDIQDMSESTNSAVGVNTFIINDNDSQSDAIGKSSGAYNTITTTTHNSYYASEVKLRAKELERIITVSTSNIDLRLLTPNKNFTIVSDDSAVAKKVNYPIRLCSFRTVFAKDGDSFNPVTTMVFKKSEG